MNYQVTPITLKEDIEEAANWFSNVWNINKQAYIDSMEESLVTKTYPKWYVVKDKNVIIAGLGVIENDFHNRVDLFPNVCAVYVKKEYRRQGIAGVMLNYVCQEFHKLGIDTLYLLTNHDAFYERYDWKFLDYAYGDGEDEPSRMYVHSYKKELK